jgi:ferrous iron transport protein B
MINSIVDQLPLITLVGPPNSGKTTLFNLLSGKNYKTVNYPGSTVEYSTARFQSKYSINALLLDSPGIISLVPNSPDEEVSVNSLYDHPEYGSPNLLIVTADASQISRHLLLCKQLINSGFKLIVAITMNDILAKKGFKVNESELSKRLNCDVICINAKSGIGLDKLLNSISANIITEKAEASKQTKKSSVKSKEDLIRLYNEIEELEKKVVVPISQVSNEQIQSANKQLKILNPTLKYGTNRPDELTLKIDRFLLHRVWGLVFFFLIMTFTFTSIFWFAQPFMELVDEFFGTLAFYFKDLLGTSWYSDLITDGIISGTGSVLVFLPQILILFLILGFLEDTGYLARGAMLVDKPLSKIGLNGKSFVPMLSGFACAIPAMLAARTIPNRRERFLTIFIIPLMSCSARLPVYVLLITFLTPPSKPWIAGIALSSIYLFSIIGSLIVASLINKFRKRLIKTEDNSSFILELPTYRMPKLKSVVRSTYENALQYIYRAGPIILVLSLVIWFLTYFPNHSPQIETEGLSTEEISQMVKAERLSTSYASELGKFIQPVMSPLHMDWRVGVSLISAFAAREVFVSSLALIFKVTDEENLQASILSAMRNAKIGDTEEKLFTTSTIVGLIVFFIFAMQCLSTVAVSKKETGSWRIPLLQIFLFTSIAYILAFITVNGLRWIGLS